MTETQLALGDHLIAGTARMVRVRSACRPLIRVMTAGAMDIASVPGHFLRPLLVGYACPVVIALGLCLVDWRVGGYCSSSVSQRVSSRCGSIAGGSASTTKRTRWVSVTRREDRRIRSCAADTARFRCARTRRGFVDDTLGRQESAQRSFTLRGATSLIVFYGTMQAAVTVVLVVIALLGSRGGASYQPWDTAVALLLVQYSVIPCRRWPRSQGTSRWRVSRCGECPTSLGIAPATEPAEPSLPMHDGVEFDAVTFSYPGSGTPALHERLLRPAFTFAHRDHRAVRGGQVQPSGSCSRASTTSRPDRCASAIAMCARSAPQV